MKKSLWVSMVLVAGACGKESMMMSSIGMMCGGSSGCSSGEYCSMMVPSGYCTMNCMTQGQTTGCPSTAICHSVSNAADGGTASGNVCVQTCNSDNDCRADAGLKCSGSGGSGNGCQPG